MLNGVVCVLNGLFCLFDTDDN
ncbi:hypothetical protein HMPREF9715_00150, partial [Myroides odoratimimus CIP 101113]